MGSTYWVYFAPYQSDIEKALQSLREEVFRRGRFEYHIGRALDLSRIEGWDAAGSAIFQEMVNAARERAKTIDGLLEIVGDSGTHTILDIQHVSKAPGYSFITQATREELLAWFGTEKPSKESISVLVQDYEYLIDCHHNCFVILYDGDQPSEICFFGVTGD